MTVTEQQGLPCGRYALPREPIICCGCPHVAACYTARDLGCLLVAGLLAGSAIFAALCFWA